VPEGARARAVGADDRNVRDDVRSGRRRRTRRQPFWAAPPSSMMTRSAGRSAMRRIHGSTPASISAAVGFCSRVNHGQAFHGTMSTGLIPAYSSRFLTFAAAGSGFSMHTARCRTGSRPGTGQHGQKPRLDATVHRRDAGDVPAAQPAQRRHQIGDRRDPRNAQVADLLLPERIIRREAYDLGSFPERSRGRPCFLTHHVRASPEQRPSAGGA
jgi:hypothetical protein